MRKIGALLVLLVTMLGLTVAPAGAITGNYVEDFEHPFVGLVLFYDDQGRATHSCSGSLLTPTVFLTAGHCFFDGSGTASTLARIYFQQDAEANPATGAPTTCAPGTLGTLCATSDEFYDYGWGKGLESVGLGDVGFVILDQPIRMSEYGALAVAGSLDRLATQRGRQEVTFTLSGYGLSRINPVQFEYLGERLMAESRLVNLTSALTDGFYVQLAGNPGGGRGGACFGDSGGPVFYGGFSSNTIVAVVSFGLNGNCRGVDFGYRTDQAAMIAWMASVLDEDEFDAIQFVAL